MIRQAARDRAVPYTRPGAGYVAGRVVERYQINLVVAAQSSRETMQKKLYSMCAERAPGDTRRDLDVDANYSGQAFKHVLAPIWLLGYSYGARKFQVVINGHTGEIAGDYPKSRIKITLAVLIALIVVLIIAFIALHK